MRKLLLAATATACAGSAQADVVLFDQNTDTIEISAGTTLGTTSTYEAIVSLTTGGIIFNEWTNAQEDKKLVGSPGSPGSISAYNFPVGVPSQLTASPALSADTFHHIAFVHDSTEQRIYLDGALVGTRAVSGQIGDGAGLGHLGSIFRDGSLSGGFTGQFDSFRISDVARYSGANFAFSLDDLGTDANTLLLYNFGAGDLSIVNGQTRVADLSGNNRFGTFGAGAAGGTSPELVVAANPIPEPSTWAMMIGGFGLAGAAVRRRARPRLA